MSLVETDWLEKNLKNVKIIDCSWHMPQAQRDGFEEYKNQHIPHAIFFDLDDNSKKNVGLPHMLVEIKDWEKIVEKMYMGEKIKDSELINKKNIKKKISVSHSKRDIYNCWSFSSASYTNYNFSALIIRFTKSRRDQNQWLHNDFPSNYWNIYFLLFL